MTLPRLHDSALVTVSEDAFDDRGEPTTPTTIAESRELDVEDITAELRQEPGGELVRLGLRLWDRHPPFPDYRHGQRVEFDYRGKAVSLAVEGINDGPLLPVVELVCVSRLAAPPRRRDM